MADATDALVEEYKECVRRSKNNEAVEHPQHYTRGSIECIKAIEAAMTAVEFMGYLKGNVLKYMWRWRDKGGVEDLKKAHVYLGWLIKKAEEE